MIQMVSVFLLAVCMISSAYAAESSSTSAKQAGKTLLSVGTVLSKRNSQDISLKRRSPIFEKDEVHVSSGARAQFRMIDSALISLQENSVLQIKKYQYQQGSSDNSALLELLSGGLRTITGAIGKDNKKAYELKTPLATIGIRGTDYEVEIVPNGMFVAVWDGVINLRSLLRNGCNIELGHARRYSYIFIDRFGQCKGLDQVPDVFGSGYSYLPDELLEVSGKGNIFPYRALTVDQNNLGENGAGRASSIDSATPTFKIGGKQLNFSGENVTDYKQSIGGYALSWGYWGEFSGDSSSKTARNVGDNTDKGLLWTAYQESPSEVVMSRTGVARYDSVLDSLSSGSDGSVSNLNVQMDVNFDSGQVNNGAISANTPAETWIGVFDGQIRNGDLSLQMNGASVVDSSPDTPSPPREAIGFIDGDFVGNNAQGVIGAFGLSESDNSSNHIEGVFLLE